jgi:hypothetical protein
MRRAGVVLASNFVATLAVATVAPTLAGCTGDKSEFISVPGTLAVGAYGELSFGDACVGSKADLCSGEKVDAVDAFTIDPPGALEVLSPADASAALGSPWIAEGMYVVHGLAPAHATVCVQARYSDGTHRKACAPVDVDTVSHVTTYLACDTGVNGSTAAPLVPAGATLQLSVQLSASDGTALGGVLAHPIDDAQLTPNGWPNYLWYSPPAGGALTIGSRLDPSFAETFQTYGPAQVTGVVPSVDLLPPTILAPGRQQELHVADVVGGAVACHALRRPRPARRRMSVSAQMVSSPGTRAEASRRSRRSPKGRASSRLVSPEATPRRRRSAFRSTSSTQRTRGATRPSTHRVRPAGSVPARRPGRRFWSARHLARSGCGRRAAMASSATICRLLPVPAAIASPAADPPSLSIGDCPCFADTMMSVESKRSRARSSETIRSSEASTRARPVE